MLLLSGIFEDTKCFTDGVTFFIYQSCTMKHSVQKKDFFKVGRSLTA